MVALTVGAEDSALLKVVVDKWEEASRTGLKAKIPRPQVGEDEDGAEEITPMILEDPP